MPYSGPLISSSDDAESLEVELQKRADNAGTVGTIFLVGADFWGRPENRAIMSTGLFLSILYFKFGATVVFKL